MELVGRVVRNVGVVAALLCSMAVTVHAAEPSPDYWAAEPDLKTVRIDSSPNESFLGVRLDTSGRIFVGGREGLFVYEPDAKGGYSPRQELLRFPKDTWVYDIEIRGHDLYLATVSAVYVVPKGVVERKNLKAHRLVWGVPNGHVHQCIHGLAFGPEGDLYFSMGDPLWYYGDFERPDHWGHWTWFSRPKQKPDHLGMSPLSDDNQWAKSLYNGVGGVFRCKPDGTEFQVVCRGMRNSCGLVFDRHWNLFTNDNDHEGLPSEYVPGRLNHAVPHGYYNWPRGWMLSKTPDRADLLDTLTPKLGRMVPVGQSYYDDEFLGEKYQNQLLVARWCTRQITRYPLKNHGASFRTEELQLLNGKDQARPVGVCVGRGGRIFATICYMAQNEASPVYRSDLVMITRADDPPTYPFEGYDATKASTDHLWGELIQKSWSRRQAAHLELMRRGSSAIEQALQNMTPTKSPEELRRRTSWDFDSITWLAASSGTERYDRWVEALSTPSGSSTASVRLQAVRALSEFRRGPDFGVAVEKSLLDNDPQVQHAAVTGLWKNSKPIPEAVFSGPAISNDTYLRQAATLLIAERGTLDQIGSLCKHDNPKSRLAGVLAAGFRLTLPPIEAEYPAKAPLSPWRKEETYLIEFPDQKVDLRKLGRVGLYTMADLWKNSTHSQEQEQLFELLVGRLSDPAESVRLQAGHFLSVLNDPRSEPLVAKVRTASETQRLSTAPLKMVKKLWVVGPFADEGQSFKRIHPPQGNALDLNATYTSGGKKLAWKTADVDFQLYNFRKLLGEAADSSYYAYTRLESSSRQPILLLPGSDDGIEVWVNGKSIWKNDVTRSALPTQDAIVAYLQPGSNDLLIRVHNVAGESGLYLHYRGRMPVVDVLPEKMDNAGFAARLQAAAQAGDVKVDPVFLKTDWVKAAREGDKMRGRKLFGSQGLGCAKCHGITADSALNGGPSLAEAGRRFSTPHLVESILFPNKQVSPVFRSTLVITKKGKTLIGLVVGETAEKVELLQSDATRINIPTTEVDERHLQETSPMPAGLLKTPDELRDILAYLLSENQLPP